MMGQLVLSLPENEVTLLRDALFYLDIFRLKVICGKFGLPVNGKKGMLIGRIAHFMVTREVTFTPPYPAVSCAPNDDIHQLELDALMLHGSFKTDDVTRKFLRNFVGQFFHFTSFSHDWLCARWYSGNPPTYREFIQFWEYEYIQREQGKKTKNQDWAYIHFVQNHTCIYPEIRTTELASTWSDLKQKKAMIAFDIVNKVM